MKCEYCGGPILPYRPNKRFCSHACRQAAYVNRHKVDELGDLYNINLVQNLVGSYNPLTLNEVLRVSKKLDLHFSGPEINKIALESVLNSLYRIMFYSYTGSAKLVKGELSELEKHLIQIPILQKVIAELKASHSNGRIVFFDLSMAILLTALLVSTRKMLN